MGNHAGGRNRRTFLKAMAASSGAFLVASNIRELMAQTATSPDWKKQIGLEMFTVRDQMRNDFEGTVAKVAEIGYKEIEPTSYGGLSPKEFRALLDRYGLRAPSTHSSATEGPDLERELEGHQIIGHKYTQVRPPRPPGSRRPGGPRGGGPRRRGAGPGGGPGGAQRRRRTRPPQTEESVRRTVENYNKNGAIAKKFGMKILIHNHEQEFQPMAGSKLTPYDILLAETDPDLVTLQIDIGWAAVAGQDVIQMFRKNPGRYELWHVKDVADSPAPAPEAPTGRPRPTFTPIGQGMIDYKPIFSNAKLAGLKHFVIEQDNAADSGDSLASARAGYQGLIKVLS